jgi:hypothetical protein
MNNTNTVLQPIMIFDVDGTLTPDRGGYDGKCMFSKGWEVYSQEYTKLKEIILLKKFMYFLRDKNCLILYNSNGYKLDILNLFNYIGIHPDEGNSREDSCSKTEYIETILKIYPNNKIYYAEDDISYLSKSKAYNVSCDNGWWLGKQLSVIAEYLKEKYILPDEVRDLYKLLRMLTDDVLKVLE